MSHMAFLVVAAAMGCSHAAASRLDSKPATVGKVVDFLRRDSLFGESPWGIPKEIRTRIPHGDLPWGVHMENPSRISPWRIRGGDADSWCGAGSLTR